MGKEPVNPVVVNPVPRGFPTVTPYLIVDGAGGALDFYQRAFSAEVLVRLPTADAEERIAYSEIKIGSSILCVVDAVAGQREGSPLTLGGTSGTFWIYAADAAERFDQAVAAGCEVLLEMQDCFWGDRMGKVVDPYGHVWCLAKRVKEPTPEEIAAAAAAAAKG